jgi:3-hydroxybutyryl-CoA dehydratase
MNEYDFRDLQIGMMESIFVDLRQVQVDDFMALSGDVSTVHVDDEYARSRKFDQRLVHGVLVASYISQLIGMLMPGKHGVLRSLNCEFRNPCYAPMRLTFTSKVERLVPSIHLVAISIVVKNDIGDVLVFAKAESVMKQ